VLVLGKPLGIGVLSAALKKGILDERGYAQMVGVTTQLNRVGRTLATLPGVHAMTDVTGFGLAGHLAEICRGSGVGADVEFGALPVLASARPLLERGIGPGAIERNWASCSGEVDIDASLPAWAWRLLCDPQTSGGLLVSCAPSAADAVLAAFAAEGSTKPRVSAESAPVPAIRGSGSPDDPGDSALRLEAQQLAVVLVGQHVDVTVGPLLHVAHALVEHALQQHLLAHYLVAVHLEARELLAREPADERAALPLRERWPV